MLKNQSKIQAAHRQHAAITGIEHDRPDKIMLPSIQEAQVPRAQSTCRKAVKLTSTCCLCQQVMAGNVGLVINNQQVVGPVLLMAH